MLIEFIAFGLKLIIVKYYLDKIDVEQNQKCTFILSFCIICRHDAFLSQKMSLICTHY